MATGLVGTTALGASAAGLMIGLFRGEIGEQQSCMRPEDREAFVVS